MTKMLNAVTSTGASSVWGFRQNATDHTIQSTITGSPTVVVLDLEGSLDEVTWFTLASHSFSAAELSAQAAMFHVTNKLAKHIRLNLATLTGGASPTVTAFYEGENRREIGS